jgi:hypothetical protein
MIYLIGALLLPLTVCRYTCIKKKSRTPLNQVSNFYSFLYRLKTNMMIGYDIYERFTKEHFPMRQRMTLTTKIYCS